MYIFSFFVVKKKHFVEVYVLQLLISDLLGLEFKCPLVLWKSIDIWGIEMIFSVNFLAKIFICCKSG